RGRGHAPHRDPPPPQLIRVAPKDLIVLSRSGTWLGRSWRQAPHHHRVELARGDVGATSWAGSGVTAPVRGAAPPHRLGRGSWGRAATGPWRPAAAASADSPPTPHPESPARELSLSSASVFSL